MTDHSPPAPFPLATGKGAAYEHSPVVALQCNDEGATISCGRCGHTYVPSVPLTGESQEADNIELARALWFHRCSAENSRWREVPKRGCKPFQW